MSIRKCTNRKISNCKPAKPAGAFCIHRNRPRRQVLAQILRWPRPREGGLRNGAANSTESQFGTFRRTCPGNKTRCVASKHRWRLARKSRARILWRGDSRSARRNCRAAEKIYRANHQQRRGILRADRCARLRAITFHRRAARRKRFRTARQTDARAIQSKERRFETVVRARKKNVANIRLVPHRSRLSRAEPRSRFAGE